MIKTPVLRQHYAPSSWKIPRIQLQLELDPAHTIVTSTLYLECTCPKKTPSIVLDGDNLELLSVSINETALLPGQYTVSPIQLTLPYPGDTHCQVTTRVRITPQSNTQLEGLYVCGPSLTTQCEAQGFRRITWMIDRPDVMSIYETTLIADTKRYPVLLSNGNPGEDEILEDGRHRVTWNDPFPKPCYLFACVAGNLATLESSYITRSGRTVRLAIYSEPHHLGCLQHAMDSLKRAMRWDEVAYGREYDLDHYLIYCADDFNMGAMENKGLNVFNTKCVLASPNTATDDDYINVERVIAHEYFHNWTGNRITCRDWFQLSFKEGWTVFREAGFAEDVGDPGLVRLQDVDFLRVHQFPEDAGPHAHPVQPDQYLEIDNFYTTTIYEKGAEVIRMLSMLMGPDAYREACDDFFERFDGQAVTCQDFLAVMQDHTTLDLQRFEHWYHQAGTPRLSVKPHWSPDTGIYSLRFKQTTPPTTGQPHKEPVMIPVQMGLLNASGQSIPLKQQPEDSATHEVCLLVDQPEQTFRFFGIKERPTPSLLRGFSAPVHLECALSMDEWLHLVRHEPDACVRDGALKTIIRTLVEVRLAGATSPHESDWLDIIGEWLKPKHAFREPGIIAHLLTLPSVSSFAEFVNIIEPLALVNVRDQLEQRILETYSNALHTLYEATHKECNTLSVSPYDFSAKASGLRALRGRLLSYLNAKPEESAHNLAIQQYQSARCLSDRVSALSALNRQNSQQRSDILEDFQTRYANDPLVLDKAWTLEATRPQLDAYDRVQNIWSSSNFDRRNPNRVRSLLYAFGNQNWAVFHALEGAPYRFIGNVLRELDRSNPNLAARLITMFARWNRFEKPWRDIQREVLATLQMQIHSPNLRELVGKYLDAEGHAV